MMEIVKEEYRTGGREIHGSEEENIELETGEASPVKFQLLPEEVTEERVRQAILEAEHLPQLPMQLIERYARLAALHGQTEQIEDGSWYAEIRSLPDVWAQANSREEVLKELAAVVRDWTLLKLQNKDRDLPEIGMINLNVI